MPTAHEAKGWRGWVEAARRRGLVIGTPYVWLLVFFLLPFLIVLQISFAEMQGAKISDIFSFAGDELFMKLKLQNYLTLFQDDLYISTYFQSLIYAGVTTLLAIGTGNGPPDLEAGILFYQVSTPTHSAVKKMIVIE